MGARRAGLLPLLGEGIFTQDGRAWKHSRELLRRQFVRINFKDLSTFDQQVDDLIDRLASAEGVVDLQPAFFRFTLATTTALIFGDQGSTLKDKDHEDFASSFDYASMISAIRLRLADLEWAYKPKAFRRACNTVKAYASHYVRQALANRGNREEQPQADSQALIRDFWSRYDGVSYVVDNVRSYVALLEEQYLLVRNRVDLGSIRFLLIRHPRVMARLKQEIDTTLGSGERLNRADLARLPYLRCILNETLRLYPQLPINVRFALKTTLLPVGGGPDGESPVLIRRGAGVGYSVYHMHRQKSLYGDDANEFRPERWGGSELSRIGWGFMPFHGGPRTCLGSES
ncbi:MAG: hypothetical protein Q9224_002882 [Gallowayella concinna]